ncbi:SDR family oxidoreductase [Pedobacter aquatilis]|uniref:SDR family NAD(P)-dependent oxidoreductase n=1 Tax=Pedobacter aquatilis TaxID=351343 RepID=UPI002931A31A|nr:SDR family oxidoreductase [Pedobacter aquatilis]
MEKLMRFNDKTIIVTGAGSGMGRACALRFVAEGARVIAVDVNDEGLLETVRLAGGQNIRYFKASVSEEEQVKALYKDVIDQEGKLDVLINMAGILRSEYVEKMTLDQFMEPIKVNLVGTFLMIREALPLLEKTKGNIVNAASTSAQYGHAYMSGYAASKGGVSAMTKTIAWEYIKRGVRINAVAPGGIVTGMTNVNPLAVLSDGYDNDLMAHLSVATLGLPMGQPEDIAGVVAMIASEDGAFINGEIIKIDGGNHN